MLSRAESRRRERGMAKRERGDDGDDAEEEFPLRYVYGIEFLPDALYIYIGSTDDVEFRETSHFSYKGGARRVTITLAQKRFQPHARFFKLEILWSGRCSLEDLRAVEQYFIQKYDTRCLDHRKDPVLSTDLDLMDGTSPPRRLNINRACTDERAVALAAERVVRDHALAVRRTPLEAAKLRYVQEALWISASTASPPAPVLLQGFVEKYQGYAATYRVGVHEVYSDLVVLRKASATDDGRDFNLALDKDLVCFCADRNAGATWPVAMILHRLLALNAAIQGGGFVATEMSPAPVSAPHIPVVTGTHLDYFRLKFRSIFAEIFEVDDTKAEFLTMKQVLAAMSVHVGDTMFIRMDQRTFAENVLMAGTAFDGDQVVVPKLLPRAPSSGPGKPRKANVMFLKFRTDALRTQLFVQD